MSGPKRILLVEPEDVLADVTAFRLELLGYIVERVASAEEASEQMLVDQPDLIITDLDLPGIDGVAFIEGVSSDQDTSDIPIMVLSFEADLDKVQAVYTAGGRDFLVVPFEPEHLEGKVAQLLQEAARQAKTKAKTATS